jgi:hypothetical protein
VPLPPDRCPPRAAGNEAATDDATADDDVDAGSVEVDAGALLDAGRGIVVATSVWDGEANVA